MKLRATLAACAALLAFPASAGAHAVLEGSSPTRGAALESSPGAITLRFNEPVEAGFGSVRVYDREGERLDDGELFRPDGKEEGVGIGVAPDLEDGVYTVTYRVISADSHPVSGGFTFTVGDPEGAAAVGVAELLEEEDSGTGLDVALAGARLAAYLATAALLGGLAFLLWVWVPALAARGRARGAWDAAASAFAGRLRRILALAVGVGLLATAAGIVIQGGIATGGGLSEGVRPSVIEAVLRTDFGTAWGLRLAALVVLGALLLAPRLGLRYALVRPVELGATGVAVRDPLPRNPIAVLALGLAAGYLALAPGLGGHPGASDPRVLALAAGFLHVLAFAVWAGGLALLVTAVPAATRALDDDDKTPLLATVIWRFSALALAAVAVLLATGVVQSILQLDAWADLVETGYGRAILAKAALLAALIGLGAYNRNRLRPQLARLADSGSPPGGPGRALARILRVEVALVAGVLVATAVLTALSPAAAQEGPFSASTTIGEAQLEVTVDPAAAGTNEIHVYLFDSQSGAQYREVRRLRVKASLPAEDIGPIAQRVQVSGPGHWVIRRAELGIKGDWELAFDARVSEFEQHSAIVEVPIR